MKKFTKGQKVYQFDRWNRNLVCSYKLLTVKSCGVKQMTAEKEVDGKMLQSFIYPNSTFGGYNSLVLAEELPTLEDVINKGLEFSAQFIANEIKHLEKCLCAVDANPGYYKSIQKDLDNILLQKPTTANYDELVAAIKGGNQWNQ